MEQAQNEVVTSAGRGDVEQADALGLLHESFALLGDIVSRGTKFTAASLKSSVYAVGEKPDRRVVIDRSVPQPGENHDRKLQPLRAMDRQHAHRVFVHFGHWALDIAHLDALEPLEPIHERTEGGAASAS